MTENLKPPARPSKARKAGTYRSARRNAARVALRKERGKRGTREFEGRRPTWIAVWSARKELDKRPVKVNRTGRKKA